jgi:plastocyanin
MPHKCSTLISAASCLLFFAGCEDIGGGAKYDAQVTVIPADFGTVAEEEDSGSGSDTVTETSTTSAGPGALTGRVVMSGAAPQLALLVAKGADVKDKEVCAAIDVADERLVLGNGNGVANVFIYMSKKPKGGSDAPTSADAMIFDQKNCQFLPHCMIVPTGQTVKVLSGDPIAHNTHTYPQKNDGVNSGVAPNDREGKLEIIYRRAESTPVPVKCDYHAWMSAYHLPLDHPYAALTDASGAFTIPELPAGEHTFSVWHEAADGGFVERRLNVEIKPGETTELTVDYPASKLSL